MVDRWEITDSSGWQHCAEKRKDGRWVRYEDYAALEARLNERSAQLIESLRATVDGGVKP